MLRSLPAFLLIAVAVISPDRPLFSAHEELSPGVAVHRGNLEEINSETGERVRVDELSDYARDRLRLDYIFWGVQEPFYSQDVIPYLKGLAVEASHERLSTLPAPLRRTQ